MGTPLNYQQSFDASWQLPINKLPVFDWVTSDVKYAATYNWERGADLDDGTQMAGTIANSRTTSTNVRMKFETLYNHVPFLKKGEPQIRFKFLYGEANGAQEVRKGNTAQARHHACRATRAEVEASAGRGHTSGRLTLCVEI